MTTAQLTLKKDVTGTFLSGTLADAVKELPYGKYHVYIQRYGYHITTGQRKLFWMWMTVLEDWSGSTKQEWHDYFVNKYLQPLATGISVISTVAMTKFMEQIAAECASEWGVSLPFPEEDGIDELIYEYMYR